MEMNNSDSVFKRENTRRRSVVDSAVKNVASLSDGCNPELVEGAEFEGVFEMPIIKRPKQFTIPDKLIPFSKRNRVNRKSFAVCGFENDACFRNLLIKPDDYIEEFTNYEGFISPDCSIYRDMPLALQITNIYRSRAIGYYFQKHGIYVVPCVRWGDERTYTTKVLSEKVAFSGIERNSIVCVGSYGQLRNRVNRYYFEAGMNSMMESLEPKIVLVYGKMFDEIKCKYPQTLFVEYPDWISMVRKA